MIKGVFFDLGGTLLSYCNVNRTTLPILIEAVERAGEVRELELIRTAYRDASACVATVYAEKTYYLHREFFNDVFCNFLDRLDLKKNEDLLNWYEVSHREKIIDCLVSKADCEKTLEKLKSMNFYLSIVSNIDENMLQSLMEREQLTRFINDSISSERAQSCKPDKRIFELALIASGLSAKEVMFVGDSPEHDIAGAKKLGFKTTLITDGALEPPLQTGKNVPKAHYTVDSLSAFVNLISETEKY